MGVQKATAIFEGDDGRLAAVIAGIERRLKRVAAAMAEVGATFAKISAAAGVALAALGVGVKNALDVGGHFNDLSANTGIAIEDLVALEQEFRNAGKSGDDVAGIIGKMQKALATGSANDTLAQLGLSMEKLRAQTPSEQFRAIGEAIARFQDPAQRAAAAMAIFGKSGNTLLAMFSSAGFGEAAKQVGSQAQILARDAALFDDISDKLALAGTKVRGFFVGVADKVAPVLKPLLDGFASLDLAKYGQAIGDAFAFIIQAFSDGKLTSIVSEALIISAKEFGNALIGIVTGAAFGLGGALVAAVRLVPDTLALLTKWDFWAGMGNALIAAAKMFVAYMLDGVANIMKWLGEAPGLDKLKKAGEDLEVVALGTRYSADASKRDANANFNSGAFTNFTESLKENISAVMQTAAEGFKLGNVFDSSANKAALDQLVGDVMNSVAAQRAKALGQVPTIAPKGGIFDPSLTEKKMAIFADASRRVGLGGSAAGTREDPLIRAQQDARLAVEKNTTATQNLTAALLGPRAVTAVFGV